jgi:hypothetical protein
VKTLWLIAAFALGAAIMAVCQRGGSDVAWRDGWRDGRKTGRNEGLAQGRREGVTLVLRVQEREAA